MVEVPSLKLILEEILKKKRSLIITLPSYIKWEDYEKELRKAANYKYVLNFKRTALCYRFWMQRNTYFR